jgi:hypothetical protein
MNSRRGTDSESHELSMCDNCTLPINTTEPNTHDAWTQFPSNDRTWIEEIERKAWRSVETLRKSQMLEIAAKYPPGSEGRQRLESLAETARD